MGINDVNDNPPVFQQQVYNLDVSEATPVNMTVWLNDLENGVTDADSNENAHLQFSVVPGDGGPVSIDSSSEFYPETCNELHIPHNIMHNR